MQSSVTRYLSPVVHFAMNWVSSNLYSVFRFLCGLLPALAISQHIDAKLTVGLMVLETALQLSDKSFVDWLGGICLRLLKFGWKRLLDELRGRCTVCHQGDHSTTEHSGASHRFGVKEENGAGGSCEPAEDDDSSTSAVSYLRSLAFLAFVFWAYTNDDNKHIADWFYNVYGIFL